MHRCVVNGVLLIGLALILPACGSSNSGATRGNSAGSDSASTYPDPGIETFPDEGNTHVPVGTLVVYLTDPPTSGNHYPYPQAGGFYETPIEAGFLVHTMEHGGIIFYYNPATTTLPQKNVLKSLANDHLGLYKAVVCVPRDDATYPLILTAWTHRLRLAVYDQSRIDGFVALFWGQGPEGAPDTPWTDPTVSNTTATSFFLASYELRISDIARPGSASADSRTTVPAGAVTISVDLEASASSTLADTQSIQIRDAISDAILAHADYDASTSMITVSIAGVTFAPHGVTAGAFHTVTFTVNAGHDATWSLAGKTTSPPVAFGTPTLSVRLGAAFAGGTAAAPDFFFGNLLVTSP